MRSELEKLAGLGLAVEKTLQDAGRPVFIEARTVERVCCLDRSGSGAYRNAYRDSFQGRTLPEAEVEQ